MTAAFLLNRRRRGAFAGAFESYLSDAALAFMSKIAANPVLDDPDLAMFVNVDEHGVFAYKGDQGFGDAEALYADPNAILANASTGPARPFIGASGGYEIAISNPVPRQDMTGGIAYGNGNAVGGYQKVTSLTTTHDTLGFSVAEPIVAGDQVAFELEVKGTAGQAAKFRVSRDGAGTFESAIVQRTFSGEWEPVSVPLTFANTQTGWRVDMGRLSTSDTATEFEVRNVWARRTKAGGGRWPMQNLGGWTLDTLPEHLSQRWGVGVEYDPATGKARRFVTGGERGELVTASTLTAANVTALASTKADRADYVMGVGERWPGVTVGSTGATWNRCNFVVGKTVTSGQTYVGVLYYSEGTSGRIYLDCRNISGAISTGAYAAVGDAYTTSPGAGTLTIVSDAVWSGSVRKLVYTFVPNFTGTCEVGFGPHSVVAGETIIGYAAQFAQGASEYPFMPVLVGGQTVHAAQKIERAANEFMPLGPNVYSANGQIGAVDNDEGVGAEFITNGTFDTDIAGWSNGGNGTIAWNASGYLDIDRGGDAFGEHAYQDITVQDGKFYVTETQVVAQSQVVDFKVEAVNTQNIGAGVSRRIWRSSGTASRIEYNASGASTATASLDNISVKEYGGVWFSSTGEGRFSVADNVLTLSAGSAAETVSLLAAPLGLSDGDVVEVSVSGLASVSGFALRNGGSATVAHTFNSPTARAIVKQMTVSDGVICNFRSNDPAAAGTVTINGVRQVQDAELSVYTQFTRPAGDPSQALWRFVGNTNFDYVRAYIHGAAAGSAGKVQFQETGGSLSVNSTTGTAVAVGARGKHVASIRTGLARQALDGLANADDTTVTASERVKFELHVNDASFGQPDIDAFAVFSRVLTAAEQEGITG